MHELGLVTHIVRTIEDIAEKEALTEIASLTLEVGEVSGVIPEYLTDCFKYFKAKTRFLKEAELKIEMIAAVTYCQDCGETYATLVHKKRCPCCRGEATYLLRGNEFNIKEIKAC